MPHNLACIRCGRVGFVRLERVIRGITLHVSYYCGACEHSWEVEEDPRMTPARATLRPKKDRRKQA